MISFEYTVTDPNGIHARPAGLLVKEAQKYDCLLTLSCGGKSADLRKLLALMGLGVRCGDRITVTADGRDEDPAAVAIRALLEQNL